MDSLRGKLLLAGPVLKDPNFDRTVVLITEHSDEGAMGLVLNRPSGAQVGEAVPDLAWVAGDEAIVFVGGPVAPNGVIALAEWNDPSHAAVLVDEDLGFVQGDAEDTEALAAALRRVRVYAGHAGWGPGQLEDELEGGGLDRRGAPPRGVVQRRPRRPLVGGAAAQGARVRAALHDAARPVAELVIA